MRCFNPLPSQEGRPHTDDQIFFAINVSIHSLRKKGDGNRPKSLDISQKVSIHSLRKKGDGMREWIGDREIVSIHSLRKKGDDTPGSSFVIWKVFQSTPFARRETSPGA